jgi:hypothetical protein
VLRCFHTEQSLGCCRSVDETCGSELLVVVSLRHRQISKVDNGEPRNTAVYFYSKTN